MEVNKQPAQKVWRDSAGRLEVHSIFKSIQGEGPRAGIPSVFVRLAGCVLMCPGCDTDYTSVRRSMSVQEIHSSIMRTIRETNGIIRSVVITGGEPFRQNISVLASHLRQWRDWPFFVEVETNGVVSPDSSFPWHDDGVSVVCSPKTPTIHADFRQHEGRVDWKYVLRAGEVDVDGLPKSALLGKRPARPSRGGEIFVQPMDEADEEKNRENVGAAVDSCMRHGYRLSLQLHKILEME